MRPSRIRALVGFDLTVWHGAWLCLLSGLGLSLLGVYAIDVASADSPKHGLITPEGIVLRQLVYLAVGLLAGAMVALPHYKWVRLIAWPSMLILTGMLVFLLLPFAPASLVTPRNGARAWLQLGPADFQPGELAKVAFVLVMAEYLRFRENHRTFLGLIPPAVIAFVPAALITLQPDLGMAMLFAPAIFAMLLTAGAKMRHLILVVVVALMAAPAAYPLLKPHQKARIDGLIKMIQDPKQGADDINYQAITAQTLAGSGGVFGMPDTKARALIRFNRLPERHNDMILAVILTRFGLVGGVAMLFLYAMWFAGAYLTAALSKDAFGQLVVVGFAAILFAQTFINVGMTIGLMPIVGLTLPFVSYGGSSMLTVWVMTGLVFSIGMRRRQRLARATFEFDDRPYDPAEATTAHRIEPSVTSRRRAAAR